MSISWGIKQRFKFQPDGSLTSWRPAPISAVFAITYNRDPSKAKSHTVLYFGQAGDLSQEAPDLNSRVLDAWVDGGHDIHELNVFVHPMPGYTSTQRSLVQEQLIAEYRPHGNR